MSRCCALVRILTLPQSCFCEVSSRFYSVLFQFFVNVTHQRVRFWINHDQVRAMNLLDGHFSKRACRLKGQAA